MFSALFRLLFVYPPVAFARGKLSLLSGAPRWLLAAAILAAIMIPAWHLRRRFGNFTRKIAGVGALQSAMLALVLLLLWRPALVVSTIVPKQNIAAVLFDDSASMALENPVRLETVKKTFAADSQLLKRLADRFQVRLYRFSGTAERITSAEALKGEGRMTRLDESLAGVLSDLQGLPLGAVVVVSDGAQNAGGGFSSTGEAGEPSALAALKARRVPLHTVGVGSERFSRDLQVDDVFVPSALMAGGIASASVAVSQEGYGGKTMNVEVRENGTLIQSVPVAFDRLAQTVTARVNFTPRSPGLKQYTFSMAVQPDEAITRNNVVSRAVAVEDRKLRVLYVEGEPRWEYKFIRRAVLDDPQIQIPSMMRTSANKFYRQNVDNEKVLEGGFPKPEEFFSYEGLVLGSMEAGFFSPEDMQAVYDFVSRRGGGLLLLGGRRAMADGGYQNTFLADLFPVTLPSSATPAFLRREARAELTEQGLNSPMLQLAADPKKNAARWKALPPLGDYQRTGEPKPGALVLARAVPLGGTGGPVPLLVTQRFGRGRVFMLATGSSWRWQMEMDHRDDSHELFWRQLLRGLASETPPPVQLTTDKPLYRDENRVELRAEVRDKKFRPIENAVVTATLTAPSGAQREIPLVWSGRGEGFYSAAVQVPETGLFTVEAVAQQGSDEIGRSAAHFERADGVLEYYHARQNRAWLESVSAETGGRYYPLDKAAQLPDEMIYSEGGITEQNAHELWHLPVVLLLLLALKGTEWGLRKFWGSV